MFSYLFQVKHITTRPDMKSVKDQENQVQRAKKTKSIELRSSEP